MKVNLETMTRKHFIGFIVSVVLVLIALIMGSTKTPPMLNYSYGDNYVCALDNAE